MRPLRFHMVVVFTLFVVGGLMEFDDPIVNVLRLDLRFVGRDRIQYDLYPLFPA